jgi:hypothetical protein
LWQKWQNNSLLPNRRVNSPLLSDEPPAILI